MTQLATAIEQAILTASINTLTRRADALRAAATDVDPSRGAVMRRTAQLFDEAADDIGGIDAGLARTGELVAITKGPV